jgi:hypothetical protein
LLINQANFTLQTQKKGNSNQNFTNKTRKSIQ